MELWCGCCPVAVAVLVVAAAVVAAVVVTSCKPIVWKLCRIHTFRYYRAVQCGCVPARIGNGNEECEGVEGDIAELDHE